jgi:hypothetical protein
VAHAWHDVVGIIGVVLILGTYVALQMERIDSRSVAYSLLNALGAGLVTVSLVFDFNLSAFVIEVVWVLVSLYGLVGALRRC